MNENYAAAANENKVRSARKRFVVESIPVTQPVDDTSHDHFRPGILAPHQRHPPASLDWRQRVHGRRFSYYHADMLESLSFKVGELYSNAQIHEALSVGNAGGVRLSIGTDGVVRRAVILTAVATARQASENPYHDRIENGVLVYTGAGREGDQSLGGMNRRLPQQTLELFPIYGFILAAAGVIARSERNGGVFLVYLNICAIILIRKSIPVASLGRFGYSV